MSSCKNFTCSSKCASIQASSWAYVGGLAHSVCLEMVGSKILRVKCFAELASTQACVLCSKCMKGVDRTVVCRRSLSISSGLWLMPAFCPRTNNMAWGMTSCSFIASCPAPLGRWNTWHAQGFAQLFSQAACQLGCRSVRRWRAWFLRGCSASHGARKWI